MTTLNTIYTLDLNVYAGYNYVKTVDFNFVFQNLSTMAKSTVYIKFFQIGSTTTQCQKWEFDINPNGKYSFTPSLGIATSIQDQLTKDIASNISPKFTILVQEVSTKNVRRVVDTERFEVVTT